MPEVGTSTPVDACAILLSRCVSVDLEVNPVTARIVQLAAVRGDSGAAWRHARGELQPALDALDAHAAGAAFLLGHNLIAFDAPQLAAVRPGLALLRLPCIDTLRLNPLAFPRNPYHDLVKHYQDGAIRRVLRNDPALDARLTLQLLQDQIAHCAKPRRTCCCSGMAWLPAMPMAPARRSCSHRCASKTRPGRRTWPLHCRPSCTGAAARPRRAPCWPDAAGRWPTPWPGSRCPQAADAVRRLRDRDCGDAHCLWCADRHSAPAALRGWFPQIDG